VVKQLLIVFTKNAQLGKVKTRLAATIGDDEALHAHKLLVEKTTIQLSSILSDKVVYYSDHIEDGDIFSVNGFHKHVQVGKDLGQRMHNAFSEEFKQGYSSIVIIGTDCPDLEEENVTQAFELLKSNELVLGPALDGGYYLIGLSSPREELFSGIEWSTSSVFKKTIEIAELAQMSVGILPTKRDIDTFDDLKSSDFGKEHFSHLMNQ
jgi:rSAM/selenodomain-associated transferase 1